MKTKTHIFLLLFLAFSFQILGQNTDSLKNLIEDASKKDKSALLVKLGGIYLQEYELDSAFNYFTKSVDFATTQEELSNAYQNIAIVYYYKDDFENALTNFQLSLQFAKKTKNDSIIARRYSDLGVIYDYLSVYDKAVEFYLLALEMFEKSNDKNGIGKIYNNLGIINQNRGQVKTALEYYNKALKIKQELGTKNIEIATTYVNIGSANEQIKNYDKALQNYLEALEIFETEGFDKYTALTINNIAGVYFYKNDLRNAKIYSQKAIIINLSINNSIGLVNSYTTLGKIFSHNNQIDSSLIYLEKALELVNNIGIIPEKIEILIELIEVYEKENQFEKAYMLQKEVIILNDSVNNENLNNKIQTLQIVYETEKKEQQIKILQNDITKNRIIWLSVAFILSLLIILIFLIFRKKLIKSQYEAKLFNQRLLRLQMNPHFIFNALTSIQSFMLEKDTKQAAIYLSSFSKLTRSILNNSRKELISLSEEIESIENYLKIQQLRFNNKFDYEIIFDDELDIDFCKIPPMLIQPFVENSIIHGLKNIDYQGIITVEYMKTNDKLKVSIEDNGIGINNNQKKTHKSHALNITNERLKILNKNRKNEIYFNFENANKTSNKTGIKVNFFLPLLSQEL